MRIAAFVLVSALVACSPPAPSSDAGGGLFPNLTNAAFRAEATIHGENGQTLPTVMIRSGNKLRMEVTSPEGQVAMINNGDTGESFVLMTRGGRTMAVSTTQAAYEDPTADWSADVGSNATRTGECSVAGETGAEWTRVNDGTPSTACVTNDGIILRATEGERVTWETTSVQRGPQDASLFVLPEGVETLDLGSMIPPGLADQVNGAGDNAAANVNAQVCTALRNNNAPAEALRRAGC